MDKARFTELLQEHRGPLERFIYFKMPSRTSGEDVLQDVLLAAYSNSGALRDEDHFKAWILKIAANKCSDFYRERGKRSEAPLANIDYELNAPSRYGLGVQQTVRDTLASLDDADRKILHRYYLEDVPQAEIARQLAIPLGTVKSRLHAARERFRRAYPYPPPKEGELLMKSLPERLPDYRLTALAQRPFPVDWEEMTGWFLIPRPGESIAWAMYDQPQRIMTRRYNLSVTGSAQVHGVPGVEVLSRDQAPQSPNDWEERFYAVQLTPTHCRMLAEAYTESGTRHYHTFLDTDSFLPNWGFGADNCGREIHMRPQGIISRQGNVVNYSSNAVGLIDIVGRYRVELGDRSFDTVLAMDIQPENGGVMTESYLDRNGRTVLWRRFNGNTWPQSGSKTPWSDRLPINEQVTINGEVFVHWYDCLSDYILK